MNDLIQIVDSNSTLFPNNELFFITGELKKGTMTINSPKFYKKQIGEIIKKVKIENYFNNENQTEIISEISKLLNIDSHEVAIKDSETYVYDMNNHFEVSISNNAIFNQSFDFSNITTKLDINSKPFKIFKNYPYSTAIIKENTIVSFACTDNGLISVETHPSFIKQGFAYDCVELLTYKLIESKKYKDIIISTTSDNLGVKKIAGSLGYNLQNKGFWIVINTDTNNFDNEYLLNSVTNIESLA